MANKEILDFTEAASLADADLLVGVQSATSKKFPWSTTRDAILNQTEQARWRVLATTQYTAALPNTTQITISDTSIFTRRLPLRWKLGGQYYYGVVASAAAGLVSIWGPPLQNSFAISELAIGSPNGLKEMTLQSGNRYYTWEGPKAYVVHYWVWSQSTAESYIQVENDSAPASVGNQGICFSNNGTGVHKPTGSNTAETEATSINYSTYGLNYRDKVSILNGFTLTNVMAQLLLVSE